jgi:serine protease Do
MRVSPIAALALLFGCEGASPTPGATQSVPATSAPTVSAGSISQSRRNAITTAVARVAPTVVTVQTEVIEQAPADIFDMFFGGRSGGQRVQAGLGSGFITKSDGVIVTNAHVIAGATRVSVAFRDGTTLPAKIIGSDEVNDVAVLKVEGKSLPVAPLGNSDDIVIGEWAIAIGNPYGFLLGNTEPSVTAGVISGTGRNLVAQSEGNGAYLDMIQTDASINPGNSGGPLINADGDVIGVNSSIYSPSGGSIGLGFAIPINRAMRIADDLLEHGEVRRPWVGIKLQLPQGNDPRAGLGAAAVVRSVVGGSPAEQAGIRPGDQLVRAGTRTIRNVFDWEAVLLDRRVGETLPITIKRSGRDQTVNVRVGDLPEMNAPRVQVLRELELVTLTPAIRAERSIRSQRGAVVFRVSSRISDEIGLQVGDVIVQVNRAAIAQASDVSRAFDYFSGRGGMRIFFERGGQIYTTDIALR